MYNCYNLDVVQILIARINSHYTHSLEPCLGNILMPTYWDSVGEMYLFDSLICYIH